MEIMHLNLWEPRGDHYHDRLAINFDITCFVIILKVTDRDSSDEATSIGSEESSFTEKTMEMVQAGTY